MTNLEKYKDRLKIMVKDNTLSDPLSCYLYEIRNGHSNCENYDFCHLCIADSLDWLSEGKEDVLNINCQDEEC